MTLLEKLLKTHRWTTDLAKAITEANTPDHKYRFRVVSDFENPIIMVWKTLNGSSNCCRVEISDDGDGNQYIEILEIGRYATDKEEILSELRNLLDTQIGE